MTPRSRARILVVALVASCLANHPAAAQVQCLPADEGVHDPQLWSARSELLRAAVERDTLVILSYLAPDVVNSFGGDGGIAEFRHTWDLEHANESILWTELTEALSWGGHRIDDTTFIAPYVVRGCEAAGDLNRLLVLGASVPLLDAPSGSRVGELSFELASVGPHPDSLAPGERAITGFGHNDWIQVHTADGRSGWLDKRWLRHQGDYRVIFARRDQRWLIRAFVAGD